MCPRAPSYPNQCIEADDEWAWRGETEEDSGPECPVLLLHHFGDFFYAWSMIQRGHLPEVGGALDQPYYLTQAFEAIELAEYEVRMTTQKEQPQQQEHHQETDGT